MKHYKRLVSLGALYSVGNICEKALLFLLIPIYTTYLSPADYGIVALMSVTVGLVSSFVFSPMQNGFNRHYYSPEYKNNKGNLVFNSFLFIAFQAICIAIIFFLLNKSLSSLILGNKNLAKVIRLYSLIIIFSPISAFLLNLLRMQEKAKLFVFASLSRLGLSAALIIYLLIGKDLTFYALIYGKLFGVAYTCLLLLPSFVKSSIPKFDFSVLKSPLKYGYPLIVSGISIFLIQAGDRYVLKFFQALSVVGLYSLAYQFAGIIDIVLSTPLKNAINPIAYQQEETADQLRRFLKNTATYFYITGCFICLGLSLYGKEVFYFFVRGKDFTSGWVIVPIVAFAYVQHALGTIIGKGPAMAKKSYYISGIAVIACITNLGLNFALIPFYGIIGAAMATLISYFVWNGLKIYYSAKFYDLHFDLRRLFQITVIGVGLYLLSFLIANTDNIIFNLSMKLLILGCYPLLLFVTGFFTQKEKDYMLMFWSRRKEFLGRFCKIKASQ